jgi:transcriptional regulator with XRE-family HTH domain
MGNNINSRVKEVRSALKLSREAFAEKMRTSPFVIRNIEYELTGVKETLILQLCDVYDVNRDWLESGEGEMFHSRASENELTAILTGLAALDNKSFAKQMIAALAQLTPEQWADIERFCRNVIKAQQDAVADVPTDSADDAE